MYILKDKKVWKEGGVSQSHVLIVSGCHDHMITDPVEKRANNAKNTPRAPAK